MSNRGVNGDIVAICREKGVEKGKHYSKGYVRTKAAFQIRMGSLHETMIRPVDCIRASLYHHGDASDCIVAARAQEQRGLYSAGSTRGLLYLLSAIMQRRTNKCYAPTL